MTKHDLKQVYYIDREIKMWQQKLDELNNKSCVGTPKLTGMPGGTATQNKVEADAIEKAEMSAIIAGLLVKLQRKRREIMDYINGIENSVIRQIMILKYVELKSWQEVSRSVYGRADRESTCRMLVNRFLRKK